MRRKTILDGFPLRVNVSLLAGAIAFAVISSLSDKETLIAACLVVGCLLTLAAVAPSLFRSAWERVKKGKSRRVEDPNTLILGWKRFCQSMGIEKAIQVKIFTNLRNAYAEGVTINIGQPLLDSLDSVSIKGVFAHELAHIKGNHTLKGLCLLLGILFTSAVLLEGVLYGFGPLGSTPFACAALSIILIALTGIAMRFISWPFEYGADLMADQCVKQGAVASCLKAVAALRETDITRDFYGHPSVNKRIANLGWSQKTRFKKWHFEL
jgi:Zn-dependent protease with chaperone function